MDLWSRYFMLAINMCGRRKRMKKRNEYLTSSLSCIFSSAGASRVPEAHGQRSQVYYGWSRKRCDENRWFGQERRSRQGTTGRTLSLSDPSPSLPPYFLLHVSHLPSTKLTGSYADKTGKPPVQAKTKGKERYVYPLLVSLLSRPKLHHLHHSQ